ncbi:hypothetical protein NGH84_12650 [Staphylococcus saprophyticus]|uniref:hypothetical protein n=1 Tax=Staphylococcus saprophyticus TaxID=29385 RepID=UPI002DBD6DB3|nr:hypothetical protein [Staphylococcus saprophyticus]MEB7999097.1 hypothetical protein [Staphylococcus saprophyticus]
MNETLDINNKKIKVYNFQNSYAAYNLPYAKDQGRFNESLLLKWDDLSNYLNCTTRGPIFPQNPNRLRDVMGSLQEENYQSEKAFNLNIFSKKNSKINQCFFGFMAVDR